MTQMTCLKCGKVAQFDRPDDGSACPECGAIYAKVLAALRQRRALQAAAADAGERRGVTPSTPRPAGARPARSPERGLPGAIRPSGWPLRISYSLVLIGLLLPRLTQPGRGWLMLVVGATSVLGGGLTGLLAVLLLLGRLVQVLARPVLTLRPEARGPLRWLRAAGVGLIHLGALVWLLGLAVPLLTAALAGGNGDATGRMALQLVLGVWIWQLASVGQLGLLMFELSRLVAFERQALVPVDPADRAGSSTLGGGATSTH